MRIAPARIARGDLAQVASPFNTSRSEVLAVLLILFGGPLVVILAEPATLYRVFGVAAFHLRIE